MSSELCPTHVTLEEVFRVEISGLRTIDGDYIPSNIDSNNFDNKTNWKGALMPDIASLLYCKCLTLLRYCIANA